MKKYLYILLMISMTIIPLINTVDVAHAATLEEQQAALNQQIQSNRKAIGNTQQNVSDVQGAISSIENQINNAQRDIDLSNQKINLTNQQIEETQNQIDQKQKELDQKKADFKETLITYYENGEPTTLEIVASASNLSDVINKSQYFQSLTDQINTQADQIKTVKNNLQTDQDNLNKQKSDIESQKTALVAQQQALQEQQNVKNGLLNDAQNTLSSLQNQQKNAQAKLSEINAQIAALSGTSNWGNGIVSQNDGGWYYQQSGNYTHLGNSPYTVSQYGCYITSFAMVATFYGNRITPTDIANMWWHFTSEGYFQGGVGDLGLNIIQSGSVNWGVVDNEISNGHPVIVSVYLPSVGKINGDGSSHFIVIKGKSGDKYLMHDPIAGRRSYSLDQIRSMRIIRPN